MLQKGLGVRSKGLNITTPTLFNQIVTSYNCAVIHAQKRNEK